MNQKQNRLTNDPVIYIAVSMYHGTDNGDGTVKCFLCEENVKDIGKHRREKHPDRGYFNEIPKEA